MCFVFLSVVGFLRFLFLRSRDSLSFLLSDLTFSALRYFDVSMRESLVRDAAAAACLAAVCALLSFSATISAVLFSPLE